MSLGPIENFFIIFDKNPFIKHVWSPWTIELYQCNLKFLPFSAEKQVKSSAARRLFFPCRCRFPVFILPRTLDIYSTHLSGPSFLFQRMHLLASPLSTIAPGVSLLLTLFRDPSVPIPACHPFPKLDTHWSIYHPHNSYLDTAEASQIQPVPSPAFPGSVNDASINSTLGRQL